MSAPRFHCDFPLAPHVAGAEIELAAAASRHIAQSLRMRIGDAVTLFDGGGGEYSAFISRIDRRGVAVRIAASSAGIWPTRGIAPGRAGRRS